MLTTFKKNNQNIFCFIFMATAVILMPSCEKFLDEKPSKSSSLVVSTASQLDALLNKTGTFDDFHKEENYTAFYSTDNNGIGMDLYNAGPARFRVSQIHYTFWDSQYLQNDQFSRFWSNEYQKIFHANLVLSNLDRVSGTQSEKEILKADAHFIRAYSYFQLVNTYCLPYTDANKNEMGLPLKTTTSFEESVARAPLSAIYDLMEADLSEALKIKLKLVQNGRARHWRANIAAVNGFAARYYLQRNNYAEGLKYANQALADYNVLVDYNTEMRYGIDGVVTIDGGSPQQQIVTIKYPYTHDNQLDLTDALGWKEFLYFRLVSNGSFWFIPSQSLLDLYDKNNDLRYQYHFVENYSYTLGMNKPSYSWPGYVFFYKDRLPSGPTTAEMYLIKAECLARLGDMSGAMTAVNTLYSKRMKTGTPALTASSKQEAIKIILEERNREMPFTMRWFDLRRLNHNEDPNDDVVLSKNFYPFSSSNVKMNEAPVNYTLKNNSRRYATPIPQEDITSSQGVMKQNTY